VGPAAGGAHRERTGSATGGVAVPLTVPALLWPTRSPDAPAPGEAAAVDGRGWLAAAPHAELVLAMVGAASFPGHQGLQRPLRPGGAVVAWLQEQRAAAAGTEREADLEAVLVLGGWRAVLRRRPGGASDDGRAPAAADTGGPRPGVSLRVPGRPALAWLAAHRPGPLLDFTAARHEGAHRAHRGPEPGTSVVDDVVVAFQGSWPAEHGTPEHRTAARVHREYLRRAAEAGLDRPARPLQDPRAEAHRWSTDVDDDDAGDAPPRWRNLGAYLYGGGATELMGTARAVAYRRAGVGAEEAVALETGSSAPTDEQLGALRALRGRS
ncbi:hypothetical protein GTQ99_19005, partial [Kineococcus sp. T13]